MELPVIVCGLGRIGWRVLEHLRAAGLPVVVVDTHCAANDRRLGQSRLVTGDCRRQEVLEEAGVLQARGVLIMTNDDLVNISTALMVRHLNPEVRIVLRMFNQNLIPRLGKAVRNVISLSTSTLTAPLFALSALTGQALGSLRLEGVKDGLRQVAEVTINSASPLCGKTIAAALGGREILALAHLPAGGKNRFLLEVDHEARLSAGDRLIVCGEPRRLAPLLPESEDAFSPVLWAGWLRRMSRIAFRTLGEVDLAVKICTGVLVSVVVISTLVLRFSVEKYSYPEALYRTISLIATGSDMHGDEYDVGWQKIFISALRVVGAALIATFTAIVTNYLLRARLGGVLEIRRIPDSGHVVVCGLGNIGFRVVEELVKAGERVVVIELSRDSRFVGTARRLGVPVLLGDATVEQVLRQAHAVEARSVVAATSNDLINLEIALLVRDLNPGQRVVLHLSDPNLARTLRESANIQLGLSIASLAAPAFVAALFGDRVHSVFIIAGRMLAAVDLVVPANDACLVGQPVRVIAVDYALLPVAVFDEKGNLQPNLLNTRLSAGYRLVAITALPDLERLLRREPPQADHAVDVTAYPLPARPWLASLMRLGQGDATMAAEEALDHLPVCLGERLTRGQAEDLLALLTRERVTARLRRLD
jgi:Trk K+ transport system NAD-binding subunit